MIRHILITGAGTGIGKAIAIKLAEEGSQLSLLGRTTATLQETASQIRNQGGKADWFRCDIQDKEALEAAVAAACGLHGPLNACIANSGIGGSNSPGPEDRFTELVTTNLIGTYQTFRASEAQLAPGPEPRYLIAVASVLARFGVPGYSGYCASKAGILGMVRALALELAPKNILVNALCPG
jgi:NAD(P)-dependent dehydrogenase (short-subunit alcohol dehydrogenase family)